MRPRRLDAEVLRLFASVAVTRPADAAALARLQGRSLRRLAGYAYRHVPFYRDAFERCGLRPDDVRSARDLSRLPVIGTDVPRARLPEMVSREVNLDRCLRRITAGTTGTPLFCPWTRLEMWLDRMRWTQGYLRHGLRPWHAQAKIGIPPLLDRRPAWFQKLGLFRRRYLSLLEPAPAKVSWLRETKPDALFTWASCLDEISRCLEREGASLFIPIVFSASDTLWPDTRRRVQERLGARVTETYGSVETGPVAWECPAGGGFHVDSHEVIVEILDEHEDRPARRGRLVCTPLWRFTMPLFRYALGDLAEWDDRPCPCGSPLPVLRNLEGRVYDLIQWPPGGGWMLAAPLLRPAYETPEIRQFQLVQEAPDRFLLRVVVHPAFNVDTERRLLAYYRAQYGDRMQVRICKVSRIRQPPEVKATTVVTLQRLEQIRNRGGDVGCFFEDT